VHLKVSVLLPVGGQGFLSQIVEGKQAKSLFPFFLQPSPKHTHIYFTLH